jgi:hypothetical protein
VWRRLEHAFYSLLRFRGSVVRSRSFQYTKLLWHEVTQHLLQLPGHMGIYPLIHRGVEAMRQLFLNLSWIAPCLRGYFRRGEAGYNANE